LLSSSATSTRAYLSELANPAGFQTNLMVQKDGEYAFKDFAKVGVPLTLIVGTFVLLLVPIVYGL
jgi:di/tricarboxylate transporter